METKVTKAGLQALNQALGWLACDNCDDTKLCEAILMVQNSLDILADLVPNGRPKRNITITKSEAEQILRLETGFSMNLQFMEMQHCGDEAMIAKIHDKMDETESIINKLKKLIEQ